MRGEKFHKVESFFGKYAKDEIFCSDTCFLCDFFLVFTTLPCYNYPVFKNAMSKF